MLIRAETIQDYAAIATVHVRAFEERAGEALIVALHRQRSVFDPELSLVAEQNGKIVGHVLFSPHNVRLLGENVAAVNLSPLAIDPTVQRQGIGGKLIAAGHEIARAKGFAFSILLGHPTYYPRFGYLTHAYGASRVVARAADLPKAELEIRPPRETDVAALHALWLATEDAVDMALDPGNALLDWLSPNPAIKAAVYSDGDKIVGYSRIHTARPTEPLVFLAADGEIARRIAAAIVQTSQAAEISLPLHPASAAAPAFNNITVDAWEAGMVCPLAPSPFDQYFAEVKAGKRPVGRPIWPPAFDLD